MLEGNFGAQNVAGYRQDPALDLIPLLSTEGRLASRVREFLPGAKPVRFVAFNKTASINWALPWHQDRVIAVQEKHVVSGFNAWTRKAGVWHVEPPIQILQEMIFARVHLDDADQDSGCMELALGTHRQGRILAEDASGVGAVGPSEICMAKRGDVLLVKALSLHRSLRAVAAVSRRVLRIDYSASELPLPLKWIW